MIDKKYKQIFNTKVWINFPDFLRNVFAPVQPLVSGTSKYSKYTFDYLFLRDPL